MNREENEMGEKLRTIVPRRRFYNDQIPLFICAGIIFFAFIVIVFYPTAKISNAIHQMDLYTIGLIISLIIIMMLMIIGMIIYHMFLRINIIIYRNGLYTKTQYIPEQSLSRFKYKEVKPPMETDYRYIHFDDIRQFWRPKYSFSYSPFDKLWIDFAVILKTNERIYLTVDKQEDFSFIITMYNNFRAQRNTK